MQDLVLLYRKMLLIRTFEERLLEEFSRGTLNGTTHTCIGQEANPVGVLAGVAAGDVVVSNHRGHGHFLAHDQQDAAGLIAELMGKRTGVCGGRGGSQHLHGEHFYTNGVLGGTMALAAGAALAEKLKGSGAIVVIFLGDGALGEGVVYESLNMAALWQVPLLIVVEHNAIAQTTPTRLALAGSMAGRFEAFGIPLLTLDTTDVSLIAQAAPPLIAACREGRGPRAMLIRTHRLGPHSKGDDTRSAEELAALQQYDPLAVVAPRLSESVRAALASEVATEISEAFAAASAAPAAHGVD